ncbi:MAG: DUF2752 domain-containing protein [Planctomycetes bacterium]|nr:DUF2752 domain-containing protein [Planctomycetota bacterium]
MLWPEKTVILCLLALTLYWLSLSFAFTPVHGNRAVIGPVVLPPCGFKVSTGLPCPTCYMTRSFTLVARGRILAALALQPMGAILWLVLALSVPVLLVALALPRPLGPLVERWPWKSILLVFFLLILASWGYTIARDLGASGPR